jgi:hypothetical protein
VAVGAAYSPEQFKRLLREGIGLGDRTLGYMTEMAPATLGYFTAAEIEAIHAYLEARAAGEDAAAYGS